MTFCMHVCILWVKEFPTTDTIKSELPNGLLLELVKPFQNLLSEASRKHTTGVTSPRKPNWTALFWISTTVGGH